MSFSSARIFAIGTLVANAIIASQVVTGSFPVRGALEEHPWADNGRLLVSAWIVLSLVYMVALERIYLKGLLRRHPNAPDRVSGTIYMMGVSVAFQRFIGGLVLLALGASQRIFYYLCILAALALFFWSWFVTGRRDSWEKMSPPD